jgi:dihydroorotase-like cyclic amidohydrolase
MNLIVRNARPVGAGSESPVDIAIAGERIVRIAPVHGELPIFAGVQIIRRLARGCQPS